MLPLDQLQKALYDALSGRVLVGAEYLAVYDFVPENEAFPYLSLTPMRLELAEVDKSDGRLLHVDVGVDVFSDAEGAAELHGILSGIDDTLEHSELELTGRFDVLRSELQSIDISEVEFGEGRIVRVGELRRRYLVLQR
jgi:hypothetical protein